MIETLTEESAREALRDVLDPETGLDLIDLGLIYDVHYDPQSRVVHVLMTLTTPACPAGNVMQDGVERRLALEPGVERVEVRVTFEPRWTPDRISAEGRVQLGW